MGVASSIDTSVQLNSMEILAPKPPQIIQIPINRFELSENQLKIINTVTPALQDYLEEIYDEIIDLVAQVNENNQSIYQLELVREDLESKNAELESVIEELSMANKQLESEKEELLNSYKELAILYEELFQKR